MKLYEFLSSIIDAVDLDLMTKKDAFDQIRYFYKSMEPVLPAIPEDDKEKKELENFIELAHKISVKYKLQG